jgi:glycosyltransferase involved in cell wall biosynthesis
MNAPIRVAYVYANSWEFAYPQYLGEGFDQAVWCDSDDFIFKYPRAAMPFGVEPAFYYFSQTGRSVAEFTHKYGFPMRRIPVRPGSLNREWSLRLFREISRDKIDLIHFYSYYRNRVLPDLFDLFALYCRLAGLPFVAHYQVGEFPRTYYGGIVKRLAIQPRRLVKAWALRSARRIFSLNRLEIESLTNPSHPAYCGLPFDRRKCVYIPNIVDPDLFFKIDKTSARRMTGCDPAIPCLLYVGFLRRDKGVQHLINLMPRLLREYPALQLWILGNGEYETELRALAEKREVASQIRFQGPVENKKLCPYYNMADVHLLPSYTESFGTVLIEAMACGTPSIGTRVGGIPEVLSDGAGLVVPPRDEEALLGAVRAVLQGSFKPDPAARLRKLAEYSYDSMGRILTNAYREALAGHEAEGTP